MRANHLQPYADPAGGLLRTTLDRLRDTARAGAAAVGLWRRRQRQRRELARLDDRMLRDIGLTRGDAEFLINKPFWRA